MNEPMSFLKAMMHAFKTASQTTAQFAAEFKALSDADKAWYKEALIEAGYQLI
jgi:hypothetical protein